MIGRKKLLAALAILAAACVSALPAGAFPGSHDCYAVPLPGASLESRISGLTASILSWTHTEEKACALFARGLLHEFQGKPELAVEDFTGAARWMPNFPAAYAMRGDAYEDMGEYGKALQDYAQAAAMHESASAFLKRCWVRAVRGHPLDRALGDCNAALVAAPNSPDVLQARCLVYFRMGNDKAAMEDCEGAIQSGSMPKVGLFNFSEDRAAERYYILGLAKIRSDNGAEGRADIETAKTFDKKVADRVSLWLKPIAIQPAKAQGTANSDLCATCTAADSSWEKTRKAVLKRASIFLEKGQFDNARRDFEEVLRRNDRDPEALFGRGVVKLKLGDEAGGNADIAAAKALDPKIADTYAAYGVKP